MRQHKDDLAGVVATELAAGHTNRAFYALEVAKTRPLQTMQYSRSGVVSPDLRPLFNELYKTDGDGRGLKLTGATATPFTSQQHRDDDLFWQRFASSDKHALVSIEGVILAYEDAKLMFPPNAAVASYFVHGEEVTLFWLRGGKLRAFPLRATASTLRQQAAALLAAVRQAPDKRTRSWEPHASALFEGLLGPVAGPLRRHEIETLYVSPDQFIANVPFDVLIDKASKDAMLIELARVTRIPSVSFHHDLVLKMKSQDDAPRILAIGNPTYPAGVSNLPFAEREATVVSEIFDAATLLVGVNATEARISELAPKHNVLHFATHGVLLGTALPGASSLLVTAEGGDGFFSATEIARLRLDQAQLAVLSACETSVGDDRGGALDLASLTGAFLVAGVPTVIGTLWHVDDVSTTKLMLELYARLHRVGSGAALREAQLALRRSQFRDPYHWAGFALYGWGQ